MATKVTPEPAEVRAQLDRILESAPFRTSRRSSDFLRRVVEGALDGQIDSLKERSLGVEVFGRDPNYDTNQDPVVRNTAGQVRKRLAQYYMEAGHEEIRIDLPAGSYVPEIYKPVVRVPEAVQPQPTPPPALRRSRLPFWLGLAGGIAALAIAWSVLRQHRSTVLDEFWAPLVQHAGPVVFCVGQGHTYKLNGDWDRQYDSGQVPQSASVPAKDVVPSFDRYIGINDAQAVLRLATLFARMGKDVELHGGRGTSLEDLRRKPVVLVGAFNNEWTLDLTGELRFYFAEDAANHADVVLDRQHPEQRTWSVRNDVPISQVQMDYAIISRVFNPTTEQAVVVAAGIKGGGTSAAAELITNADYLGQAVAAAPAGWSRKNMQMVLAVRMFSGSPGPAKVIASHYW